MQFKLVIFNPKGIQKQSNSHPSNFLYTRVKSSIIFYKNVHLSLLLLSTCRNLHLRHSKSFQLVRVDSHLIQIPTILQKQTLLHIQSYLQLFQLISSQFHSWLIHKNHIRINFLKKITGILPIMPLVPGYPCSVPGYPWSVPGYPGSVPACPQLVPGCP